MSEASSSVVGSFSPLDAAGSYGPLTRVLQFFSIVDLLSFRLLSHDFQSAVSVSLSLTPRPISELIVVANLWNSFVSRQIALKRRIDSTRHVGFAHLSFDIKRLSPSQVPSLPSPRVNDPRRDFEKSLVSSHLDFLLTSSSLTPFYLFSRCNQQYSSPRPTRLLFLTLFAPSPETVADLVWICRESSTRFSRLSREGTNAVGKAIRPDQLPVFVSFLDFSSLGEESEFSFEFQSSEWIQQDTARRPTQRGVRLNPHLVLDEALTKVADNDSRIKHWFSLQVFSDLFYHIVRDSFGKNEENDGGDYGFVLLLLNSIDKLFDLMEICMPYLRETISVGFFVLLLRVLCDSSSLATIHVIKIAMRKTLSRILRLKLNCRGLVVLFLRSTFRYFGKSVTERDSLYWPRIKRTRLLLTIINELRPELLREIDSSFNTLLHHFCKLRGLSHARRNRHVVEMFRFLAEDVLADRIHDWNLEGENALHVLCGMDRELYPHSGLVYSDPMRQYLPNPKAWNCSVRIAEILLRCGIDVDERDGNGLTPLMHVIDCVHESSMDLALCFLMRHGASREDVIKGVSSAVNSPQVTPDLWRSLAFRPVLIRELKLVGENARLVLFVAIAVNHKATVLDTLRIILDQDPDSINAEVATGTLPSNLFRNFYYRRIPSCFFTPLMMACFSGNFKVVDFLLSDSRCDVAAVSSEGLTALGYAVDCRTQEMSDTRRRNSISHREYLRHEDRRRIRIVQLLLNHEAYDDLSPQALRGIMSLALDCALLNCWSCLFRLRFDLVELGWFASVQAPRLGASECLRLCLSRQYHWTDKTTQQYDVECLRNFIADLHLDGRYSIDVFAQIEGRHLNSQHVPVVAAVVRQGRSDLVCVFWKARVDYPMQLDKGKNALTYVARARLERQNMIDCLLSWCPDLQ